MRLRRNSACELEIPAAALVGQLLQPGVRLDGFGLRHRAAANLTKLCVRGVGGGDFGVRQSNRVDHHFVYLCAAHDVFQRRRRLSGRGRVVAIAEKKDHSAAVLIEERGDAAIDRRPHRRTPDVLHVVPENG